MIRDPKIADSAERDLADPVGWAVLDAGHELAVMRHLAASEDRPRPMLQRRLGHVSIVVMALGAFSAPDEHCRQPPARRDFVRVKGAGREAFLVHTGFKLLGVH